MDTGKALEIIGQNIRLHRKAQNLNILELEKKSGISYSSIAALENERAKNVTLETLINLAAALDISLEQLIKPIEGGI